MRLIAKYGMQQTEGTRVVDSMAKLSNAMTGATTALVPALNGLRDVVAELISPVRRVSTELDKFFGTRPNNVSGPGAVGSSRVATGTGHLDARRGRAAQYMRHHNPGAMPPMVATRARSLTRFYRASGASPEEFHWQSWQRNAGEDDDLDPARR